MAMGRAFWIHAAVLMVKPILQYICDETFKAEFPAVEVRNNRNDVTSHLEALARSLQGVAPWLELQLDPEAVELAPLARRAIALATDPKSSQYMDFMSTGTGVTSRQPLVDSAILAHAILRAPTELWAKLDAVVKANVVEALKLTRTITPYPNNWVLFASMIETFLLTHGEEPDLDRLLTGLQLHKDWYLGDGWWGDGAEYVHNYYNSFVIQPMLYEIIEALHGFQPNCTISEMFPNKTTQDISELESLVQKAVPRTAAHIESVIAPDGSFPAVGRSLVYRSGICHVLSLAALKHLLPSHLAPGQARTALTRVINRTLDARAYDKNGWLRIGLIGSQPELAQHYISQGSLYQAAAVFLPLGLPASDLFWKEPDMPTTWERLWNLKGKLLPAAHSSDREHHVLTRSLTRFRG